MDHVQAGEIIHALGDPEHKLKLELKRRPLLAHTRLQEREKRAVFAELQDNDVRVTSRADANERHHRY